MNGEGEEVLGPITHTNLSQTISRMKEVQGNRILDGFVLNRHNGRFYDFEKALETFGLTFNVEFYIEMDKNEIKKRSFLPSLLNDPAFSDFTIRCDDKSWEVHRCILAAHSRFFKQKFSQDRDGYFVDIDVTSVNAEATGFVVKWMYAGESDNTRLKQALPLAHEWDIPGLLEDIFLEDNNITSVDDAIYSYSNQSMRKQSQNILEAVQLVKSLQSRKTGSKLDGT